MKKSKRVAHYNVHNQHHYIKYQDRFRSTIKIIIGSELIALVLFMIAFVFVK